MKFLIARRALVGLALVLGCLGVPRLALTALAGTGLPAPWVLAGSSPKEYEIGLDSGVTFAGKPSAYIKSIGLNMGEQTFGTLMQTTSAKSFRGKTIRWTAQVKTANIQDWAGLWMRIDSPEKRSIRFDNMQDRKIMGSVDWTKYEITLDVPTSSSSISFGILLGGRGTAYINHVSLDEVLPPVKPHVQLEFEAQ